MSLMSEMRQGGRGYWLSAPALALYIGLLVLPLGLTLLLSFNVFDYQVGVKSDSYTLANYTAVVTDSYFYEIFLRTFWISALVTLLCVLIGVPEAYILSRMGTPWRSIFLILILTPLLISVVVRAFGWSLLLGADGLINQAIQFMGGRPVKLLYTPFAVIIALVHVMLPFMIIPVWTSLQKLDPTAEQAALSLGASQAKVMRLIVLPQVMPGVLSGSLIVFGLAASSFAIPGLLGGRRLKMVATVIYDQYLSELNWPMGATLAVALLLVNLLVMLSWNRLIEGRYKKTLGE
ncbi:ABC transporter permease [Pseudomonas amygdali pv. tabaci str. ATCC 11528]|uniref:Binding-protein dependent transport system inner membrane protein n=5 Tax=Pseudomonas syringae group genomosp. 2 TaxID=251698 RepID=A0AAX1VU35_PSEAJ|nr:MULTISPECIES: ABC transporter permease [Pseudomonas syringae group]KEZ29277.1 ABC transporter permease [Pseudomonas amygdali pv. tabaci str. 6605]KKY53401.1 ABC transporter permease [Pseudomonas amygdali pv. tabaci str. ATCC 11528]KPX36569.1 Binding-protein dependent transport system inner membrane protein [Pseudomonas ficuserectae]KPX54856.1 Binding-protein dependent transport system inner membrane protein [Pseudomonas amygdali pv. hibisci]KPY78149.1 Binding-protein dependent transport sys